MSARSTLVDQRPIDEGDPPCVSVVVAIYDVASFLPTCVDSLLAQSHAGIELILVDDGSTDASGDICEEFARRDSRVRVIHKPNGGLSDARNAGLAIATAPFVMFIDGDDWVAPVMVERMLGVATEKEADVVVAGFYVDYEDAAGAVRNSQSRTIASQTIEPGTGRTPELAQDLIPQLGYAWNKLYRRQLLVEEHVEFESGLSLIEDIVFNAEVLSASPRVCLFDEAFVHYVQRPRPTLGTLFKADHLAMRRRSARAVRQILRHWGATEREIDGLLLPIEVDDLVSTVRRVCTEPTLALRSKQGRLRDIRGEHEVRELITRARHSPYAR